VLTDPSLYAEGDPFAVYAELSRAGAPTWEEPGFWAVATHAEVSAIGADPVGFCSSRGILLDEIGSSYDTPPTMMHTDPPQHTRYRRLVQPGFKPSMVRLLEGSVTAKARALVSQLPTDGSPIDIVPVLSIPYPLQVICELLGVDGEQWPRFYEWSEAVIPGETDLSDERRGELQVEMWTYLVGVANERRAAPKDDVVSELASGELTEAELAMFLIQLLVAGNETTRNLISGGLAVLAEHPDQWAALRRDRSLFGPDASLLRIDRSPNPHVSFGFGPHFCLGAALARLEARAVLAELLDRFETISLAQPVERTASSVIAGVRSAVLHVN
jgi:cytochrome P450